MTCLAFGTVALWFLGYPDRALARLHEAHAVAQKLAHPLSLALTLHVAARLHVLRRETDAVQEWTAANMALSSEHGFVLFLAMSTIQQGWAWVDAGQSDAGIAQLRQGLTAYQDTGALLEQSVALTLLAEAHGKAGQAAAGSAVLTEAFGMVAQNGDRSFEAELYRLKGELQQQMQSRMPSPVSTPEACFLQALDVARRQRARSLELRAATGLSRLWQRQGKQETARQLLAEIYGWFTEGFDTPDLQDARDLLEALA